MTFQILMKGILCHCIVCRKRLWICSPKTKKPNLCQMQLLSCNGKDLPSLQTTFKWSCSLKNTQAVVISRTESVEWKKMFLEAPKKTSKLIVNVTIPETDHWRSYHLPLSERFLHSSPLLPPSSQPWGSNVCCIEGFFFFRSVFLSLPLRLPFPFHSFTLLAEMLYCGSWCFGEVFPSYPLSFGKWRNDPMAILQG